MCVRCVHGNASNTSKRLHTALQLMQWKSIYWWVAKCNYWRDTWFVIQQKKSFVIVVVVIVIACNVISKECMCLSIKVIHHFSYLYVSPLQIYLFAFSHKHKYILCMSNIFHNWMCVGWQWRISSKYAVKNEEISATTHTPYR